MHNEKYYADLFRLREADAADTQRGASASPSLSTLDGDGFPPIAEDEETRAMQLTGFRANDPFLASANARFEARLEARHSSSGARKLEQFGARNALAQSLREVQAARAEARAAQQAEELFYLKTGGEVLSGEEISFVVTAFDAYANRVRGGGAVFGEPTLDGESVSTRGEGEDFEAFAGTDDENYGGTLRLLPPVPSE